MIYRCVQINNVLFSSACIYWCVAASVPETDVHRNCDTLLDRRLSFVHRALHPTPSAFNVPVRGVPVGIMPWRLVRKTRIVSLTGGEKCLKIRLAVLTESTNVTDRHTDIQTHRHRMTACVALRGKNCLLRCYDSTVVCWWTHLELLCTAGHYEDCLLCTACADGADGDRVFCSQWVVLITCGPPNLPKFSPMAKYPYRNKLLHGASDLDQRCLKTRRSAVVAFVGDSHQISLPLPTKLPPKLIWGELSMQNLL